MRWRPVAARPEGTTGHRVDRGTAATVRLVAERGQEEIRPDDPGSIRRMFRELAPDYDRLNSVLTFGLVHRWRRALVRTLGAGPGGRYVDVCAGTGMSTRAVRRAAGEEAVVVGVDFTPEMLERSDGLRVLGDALRLPFPDGTFDGAISSFALRDIADPVASLGEMARVLRPGGRLGILEIGRPRSALPRAGFDVWFRGAVPRVAGAFGHRRSHDFLVRSVRYLPPPEELCRELERLGLVEVGWRPLTLGAASLFVARRGT